MKTLALIAALSLCWYADAEEIQWRTWSECKTLARADSKAIVVLFSADWCHLCHQQKATLESLYRSGKLRSCHFALVDADKSRELFDSLREPTTRALPQLLISDLIRHRVVVGAMDEDRTYRWLTGRP